MVVAIRYSPGGKLLDMVAVRAMASDMCRGGLRKLSSKAQPSFRYLPR